MKEITLDRRLRALAAYVETGAVAADIGCDHGYLAAYLAQNGITKHVYASDINPLPLAKAEKLVEEYGLADKVTTVLSNGLEGIPHEVNTIIIAGMGGELIAELLDKAKWTAASGRRLILQPMTFADRLRRYLAENGFEITAETPIIESKHTYCIISAVYTGISRSLSDFEAIIGKIDTSSDDGFRYAERLQQKYSRILEGLSSSKEKQNTDEIRHLLQQLENCLNASGGNAK